MVQHNTHLFLNNIVHHGETRINLANIKVKTACIITLEPKNVWRDE